MNILYYIFLLPLLFLAYMMGVKLQLVFNKDISEARGESSSGDIRHRRKQFEKAVYTNIVKYDIIKSHFACLQSHLDNMGNPFNLNPVTYYLIKLIPVILFLLMIALNKFSLYLMLVLFILFIYVDLKYYVKDKQDREEIKKDMPKVIDTLVTQTYSDVPFDNAILTIYRNVTNKRFYSALVNFSANIISKKDISAALRGLEKAIPMEEIYSFSLAVEQGIETGRIRDMLIDQKEIITQEYLGIIDDETEKGDTMTMLCLFLLLAPTAVLIFYGLLSLLTQQLSIIFK